MTVEVAPVPRGEWSPLPYEGAAGVDGKVLVHEDDLVVAMLRFRREATIHEHAGEGDAIVVCLDGEGFTSVAGEVAPIRAGERVRWPHGVRHRLWTEGSEMTTLMVERPPGPTTDPATSRRGIG